MKRKYYYLDRSELYGGVAEGGWVVLAPGGVGVARRPPQLRPAHPGRHVVRGGAGGGGGPVHVVRDGRPVVRRRRSADDVLKHCLHTYLFVYISTFCLHIYFITFIHEKTGLSICLPEGMELAGLGAVLLPQHHAARAGVDLQVGLHKLRRGWKCHRNVITS